jgi:hypothetical protein
MFESLPGKINERGRNFTWGGPEGFVATLFGKTPGTTKNPFDVRGVLNTKTGELRDTTRFAPFAATEMAGGMVEGKNRLVPFFKQLAEGVDPEQARKAVEGTQVAYRGYTPFERILKILFPFYGFTKGSAQNVARELLENPGGRLAQTIRAATDAKADEPFLPEYIQRGTAIPIPSKIFGWDNPLAPKPGEKRFIPTLGLMHEDPLQFLGNAGTGALFEMLGRLNPTVKGAIEQATGKSLFQQGAQGGRNLADMDPMLGRALANVSELLTGEKVPDAVKFPGSGAVENVLANSPLSRVLSTTRQLSDPRKDWLAKLLNVGTGLKVTDISPAAEAAIQREAVQQAMRDLGGRSFDVVNISKEQLARMSPSERDTALHLKAVLNKLQREAKERAKKKREAGGR